MEEDNKSRKPSSNPIKQQRLKGYQPVHSLKSTILILLVFGVLFFVFGIALYLEADKVIEVSKRYDDQIQCKTTWDSPTSCRIQFDVKDDMKKPIFVYYGMKNFYQNYRTYVKSKSYAQLRGDELDPDTVSICNPVEYNKDLNIQTSLNGEPLAQDDYASPCGLIAKSVFNDTYSLFKGKSNKITIRETGIALESDLEYMYRRANDYNQTQWLDVEDEHFINWMKVAAGPNFWKLWGVIEEDLESGSYEFEITNNYDVSGWGGKKYIILSTANALGGKNYFLGTVFLCAGILSCIATVFFCSMGVMSKKKVSDHLKWK